MHCPYCKTPISENTPACPRCALNIETAGNAFGAAPSLQRGVNDTTQVLTEVQRHRLHGAFVSFHDRFPQIHLSLATVSLAPETGLAAYAFWLFNRSGICPTVERGGANHDILLTLDTLGHRAHLTFGYGLEPFVGESVAQTVLASASTSFSDGDWAEGVLEVATALHEELAALTAELDRTYGISSADFYAAEKERLDEISGSAGNTSTW